MGSVADATATMVKNIEATTGHAIGEWIRRARSSGFNKHSEILKWLKEKHGIGHGYAEGTQAHIAAGSIRKLQRNVYT